MYDKVQELLLELNATEEQFDAPVVYGSGRDGYMMMHLGDEKKDMGPLFQTILDHIPPPFAKPNEPFHMLVSNIDWSDYVGRIAIGKVLGGAAKVGDPIFVIRHVRRQARRAPRSPRSSSSRGWAPPRPRRRSPATSSAWPASRTSTSATP